MTKRLMAVVLVLALALMAGTVTGCGEEGLPDEAVAQVGAELITQEEFDARLAIFELQFAGAIPDRQNDPDGYRLFQQQVVDYMVMHEVVNQQAESLGVSVTDAEIQQELDAILENTFGGDQARFDEALKADGLTLDQIKVSHRESMLLQKAYEQVTKDVTTVPDADIIAYFEQNKAEYFVEEMRTVRHILISPTAGRPAATPPTPAPSADGSTPTTVAPTTTTAPPTEAEWAAALATAEKVRTELIEGADWTDLAAEYSNDRGTKDVGGDLGNVSKGQMVPEFEEAAFSLAVDQVSEPVRTAFGYHIIQVTAVTEAKQYTLEDEGVKSDITSVLLQQERDRVWADWLAQRKAEISVVIREGMALPTTTTTTVGGATSGATDTTAAPTTTPTTGAE